MTPLALLLLTLAAVGHFALAIFLFNRLHARAWRYRSRQALERLLVFVTLAIPILALARCWPLLFSVDAVSILYSELKGPPELPLVAGYVIFCWFVLLLCIPLWLWPKVRYRVPATLIENDTQVVDLSPLARPTVCGAFPQLCAALPGNEVFRLNVQIKKLKPPRLPAGLKGLKIAHLTDLHLTGKIGIEYFREVIERTNELRPDIVVLTGDIAEKTKCLPWIRPLFEKLHSPLGRFYILGNHDFLLPDVAALRVELKAAGFVDLHGTSARFEFHGTPLLLAGNELPWNGPAPLLPECDETFRILLAHTPDLFSWAQQQHFDLMLAGHNHGGQICLPLIGPLVSPSKHGTRYAAGLFQEGPTILHVARGVSGEHLLRWNCPPELALIVLE
jgi:predicted MPP superfamily phosphohydrolase